MSTIYCVDDRHGTPCPMPCLVCEDEDCDPNERVTADTPQDAARAAGWSEAYIAEQDWSAFDPDAEWNDGKVLIAGVLYDAETLQEADPQ